MMALTLTGMFLMPIFAQGDTEAIEIQNGVAELFVDDYLIDTQEGLKRTLHQPVKENGGAAPVITLPADSFGGATFTLEANGSLVFDSRARQYVMYAMGFSSELGQTPDRVWEKVLVYRFTSPDAMTWSEGERVFPRTPDDLLDASSGARASNLDLFSCYYDETDVAYPYKGLLWYANWGDDMEGSYFVQSKDGKVWERGARIFEGFANEKDMSCRRIMQDGRELAGAGDVTLFTFDKPTGQYLALIKFFSVKPVEFDNRLRSRAYGWMDRLDQPFDLDTIERVELVPPAAKSNGDMPYDEYYASTAWRYGSMWLGGLKIWHGGGDYPYSAAGSAFLKLVSSRDGLHWRKVQYENDAGVPEVWLGNGVEGGNGGKNDGGYMTELSTGPIAVGDELIYYYACSSWGKNHPQGVRLTGGGIFRARLRVDGFVSVDRGSLTTKPLVIPGRRLLLNSKGNVRIDILSVDGAELATATINGDSIRHEVRFDGKELGDVTERTPCRLRFTVRDGGQLYSFSVL